MGRAFYSQRPPNRPPMGNWRRIHPRSALVQQLHCSPMKRRGLSIGLSLGLATILGVAFVGSSFLKSRHLQDLARHVEWQPPGFAFARPGFDRGAYLQGAENTAAGDRDPEIRKQFEDGVQAFLEKSDRKALSRLSRVVAAEPDWAMARFYLGAARLASGNPISAAEDMERAMDGGFEAHDGPTSWWLALAQLYAGQFDRARPHLEALAVEDQSRAEEARAILARLDEIDELEG